MKKGTISLALQIAQLLEDYSEVELRNAVSLLRKHGLGSALLEYLSEKHKTPGQPNLPQPPKTKPVHESTSRAVLSVKNADPEKFRVLEEADALIRRGQLLPTNEDLRRFGERLSKDFEPKKSRKETISSLMAVLADRSVRDIEELVEFAASFGVEGNTDEYQRLAHFLIKGKRAT